MPDLTPDQYLVRLKAILGISPDESTGSLSVKWETPDEARQQLSRVRVLQQELRLLRKAIQATTADVRSGFTTARAQVGAPTVGNVILGAVVGRKALGKGNALQRDQLRLQQHEAVAPYEAVVRLVDNAVRDLDRLKLEVEERLAGVSGAAAPLLVPGACPACSAPTLPAARFCGSCGARLRA